MSAATSAGSGFNTPSLEHLNPLIGSSTAPGESRSMKCTPLGLTLCHAMKDKSILVLTAVQTAVLISDGITTKLTNRRGYTEVDPVARFFIGRRPTWSRMASLGAFQVVAETWLAERMKTSQHPWVRRLWWMPQIIGIAGNVSGTVNNLKLR
jgi:hypothetical protein